MNIELIDWSRAQFALTAMYHWLFVPLTLGLGIIMSIMETIYHHNSDAFWKSTTQFWQKIFGINFAIGVATGIILEFEFGTNWSNYSWFVGDIFGAPLAIEGILAFFMEATFVAVMFFGWEKVSKRFHLTATWLTAIGATISAWWILVANSWMQHPTGMEFNPDTVRNEMMDFFAVALQPTAIVKFFHSVMSGWVVGAAVVTGISCWFLLKQRHARFAVSSMKVAAIFGLFASLTVAFTGDASGIEVAKQQPMKLAAAEGLRQGSEGAAFSIVPGIEIPKMLSILATHDSNGYVPGINDLVAEGGKRIENGRKAIAALGDYRAAKAEGNDAAAVAARKQLDEYMSDFGYGYLQRPEDLVPPIGLTYWAFRIMTGFGCYLIAFFAAVLLVLYHKKLKLQKWMYVVGFITIPISYIAGQAGWIVAEVGRQPWAIQDLLPVNAAISRLNPTNVKITFSLFLIFFTILLIAEIRILCKAVKNGPELPD